MPYTLNQYVTPFEETYHVKKGDDLYMLKNESTGDKYISILQVQEGSVNHPTGGLNNFPFNGIQEIEVGWTLLKFNFFTDKSITIKEGTHIETLFDQSSGVEYFRKIPLSD